MTTALIHFNHTIRDGRITLSGWSAFSTADRKRKKNKNNNTKTTSGDFFKISKGETLWT